MIGSFITGSQTEVHRIRMLKEAVKFLIRITVLSMVIFSGIYLYKTPLYHLKIVYYYYKADSLKSLLKPTDLIEVTDSKGNILNLPLSSILSNKVAIKVKTEVEKGFLIALRNSFLIPILIPIWFFIQGKRRSRKTTLRGLEKVSPHI